ncbi:MAG: hypothetical protein ABI321_20415 [Polyangia bacterium]
MGTRQTRALLVLALALGLVYLLEYAALPFVDGPLYDSLVYLEQARRIRLGQHVDPTLLAFSPLYGYFLAAFGAFAHGMAPLVAQVVLGVVDLWLLQRITTRLFSSRAAWFAMLAWLLYGPLLFYQSKVLSETVGLTLLLCAIERLVEEREAQGGVLLALSVLARASLLVMLPLFVLERLRLSWRRALVLVLAIAAPLVAHGLYVEARTGIFVPVILVSSTAATATRSDWTGDLDTFRRAGEAHVGAFSVVDQARERLAHPDAPRASISILGWLEHAPKKALYTLRDEETSFDYGFYGERSEVWTLRLLVVSFGMLASWALVGAWYAVRDRKGAVLLPVVLGIFAVTTLFHPSARYRLPLVLALAPLAGLAWSRADRRLLAAIGLVFLVHGLRRGLEHPGLWQLRVAESAAVAGDEETCVARVHRARELEPGPAVEERARYVATIMSSCR